MPLPFRISVERYDPDTGKSYTQEYEIPAQEHFTVLDALNEIKDTQDGTLTHRFSCKMGICGSCGMMVNGKPVLSCTTQCAELPMPIAVAPMRNFPVIKDLVVDLDDGMRKLRTVMPYMNFVRNTSSEVRPQKQSPRERLKIDQTSQCIKCMLCYSACPVYSADKNFLGPAASALAYRYNEDSRDSSRGERLDRVIGTQDTVWSCSFVGECSRVCPKRVDPAKAVQRLKVMGALRMLTKPFSRKSHEKK